VLRIWNETMGFEIPFSKTYFLFGLEEHNIISSQIKEA